jgi:hypothetical protein
MRKFASLSVLGLTLMLAASTASAQVSGTMTATATVGASLSVAAAPGATGSLRFGTLVQGAPATTTAASGANAGRFDITGTGSALAITFTSLPSSLTGPSGATIAMTAYQACYTTTTVNTGCTTQPITAGPAMTGSPALSGAGLGYVFIGGTLGAIAASQAVGTYNGTITMQVVLL